MSKITSILGYSNYELIRSKIAFILADELSNQKSLNEAAIIAQQNLENPDQSLIDFYQLNVDSIPGKVWEERFYRPQPSEMPLINVVMINVPLNEGTSNSTQIGVNKYQVEVYQSAKSLDDQDGDVLATLKLHRLLSIIRAILMDRNYVKLDLIDQVGYRQAQDIVIGLPNQGADDANSFIYGKIDLMVKTQENVLDLEGVTALIGLTNMQIYDSEKGYYWEI